MLFGKSIFQSVIDRLADEASEDAHDRDDRVVGDSENGAAFRIRGLGSSFVTETPDSGQAAASAGQNPYLDAMEDLREIEAARLAENPPAPPTEPEPPAWIDRLSAEEIAADLALMPGDDRETLQEKRRSFARENHPDRVHARFAREATIRMTHANRLIDDAISLAGS